MPDILLEPPDLLAHGRLRAVDALARAGEAARVDHGNEAAQEVEVQHGTPIRITTANQFMI